MVRFWASKPQPLVLPVDVDTSIDREAFRRNIKILTIISCSGSVSFVMLFAWFGLWHLLATSIAYGIASLVCFAVYTVTGRAALIREIFLAIIYATMVESIFFYGAVRSPGSMWLVAVPTIAILLGSIRSGLVWMGIISASIIGIKVIMGNEVAVQPLAESDLDWLYALSLILLIMCLAIYVGLVDHRRRLAMHDLAQANDTVRKLALSDPLTGVFNRRHLTELIALDDAKPPRARSIEAVLMIDIDHFKSVNDTYGHLAGDDVIRSVANAIAAEAGPDNPVGRFGGEEFVCLVQKPGSLQGERSAEDIAEAIRHRVARLTPDRREGPQQVTVSIGLARCGCFGGGQAALTQADFALYAAKAAGRNCVRSAQAPPPQPLDMRRSA